MAKSGSEASDQEAGEPGPSSSTSSSSAPSSSAPSPAKRAKVNPMPAVIPFVKKDVKTTAEGGPSPKKVGKQPRTPIAKKEPRTSAGKQPRTPEATKKPRGRPKQKRQEGEARSRSSSSASSRRSSSSSSGSRSSRSRSRSKSPVSVPLSKAEKKALSKAKFQVCLFCALEVLFIIWMCCIVV